MWVFEGEIVDEMPEGYFGFVYLITRLRDGKRYVGQKKFHSYVMRPPLAGKKRRRRIVTETDWKTYFGSNDELQTSVAAEGEVGFLREILHLCRSKAEMNYLEAREIFGRDAVVDETYFNRWVSVKVNANQLRK